MDNLALAKKLSDFARQLEKEGNLYRVRAYRQAAQSIRALETPITQILQEKGPGGLARIPGIGSHLSFTIERLATTGQFHALAQQAESIPPEEKIENLPGVGPKLAELLWEKFRIHSVSELAKVIHSQAFAELPIGPKRREKLIASVAEKQQSKVVSPLCGEPNVAQLLAIDEEYRRRAEEDRLVKIAAKRKSSRPVAQASRPREKEASESLPPRRWLPLLSLRRDGWKFRALFANSALAHRLGRTDDWVVIYFHNDRHTGQRTIVTEERGELRGRRVVRGREDECRQYYRER